ncbi:MAG TPA: MFS transporter [Acidimicrobiia bacterium]|jgi:sugar phosphate permease
MSRRIGLGGVLAITMASSTFALPIFGVLGTTLREEFSAARWQIGILVTVVTATGALVSPMTGSFADRLAPRHSTALTLVMAGTAFLLMGLSVGYFMLAAVSILSGVAQALANPATNRLIMSQVEAGRRGFLTGIKQAGVQAGNFLAGILLPLGAASFLGWRGAVALAAIAPLVGLAILYAITRGVPRPPLGARGEVARVSSVVIRLAFYGGCLGFTVGALQTYLPSYGEEGFGLTTAQAGALVAVFGLTGFVTRLSAGPLSERVFGHHRTLAGMAAMTALAALLLAMAPSGAWLWLAAILVGLGPMAWNVVGNLAVMELSPPGAAGRGSGVMMAGFLGGVALGAPVFGATVDLTGTYLPGWIVVAVLGVVATWLAWGIREDRVAPVAS